ncbi:MAG: glycosyltransferase family 4 protein [Clostridiales bacterium]|nr:glycosyltransferase family 4 protein [Clostridiales bacterium]
MITILNLISDTNIGGAGRVILNYLKYTDRARFRTLVAVPRGSALIGPLKEAGAEVHEVDAMADRSYSKEDVKVLTDFIRRVKPDLVHTHGCLSGRIAAKKCGLPVVYSRHSAFPVPAKLKYPPGRWVNRWLNQHYADRIIAVSPATMDNLVESGVSPKRITVVMNGVAPLTATTPEEQTALKKELGIGPDTVVFGILARIEEYKGHALIAQAARQLKAQGRDFKVLVAGTGQWAEELDRLVRKLDVEDVMPRLGFRSDVAALLSILDVQLNASFGTEATSIALLEGMSLSKPSIVSDYGGNPWLVKDGDNGLVFPSRNSEALAAAMERLMDHPEQRQAMGRRAREIFEERFTGQVFARNTEQVYLEVLKGAH